MEKAFSLILVLLLLLTSCQADTNQPAVSEPTVPQAAAPTEPVAEPTASTEETQPPKEYSQQTMLAVSMPVTTRLDIAENGQNIFRYSYQTMQLTLQDPDVADAIILDYLSRVDRAAAEAEASRDTALQQYSGQEDWVEQFYSLIYSPTRIDQGVLSLSGLTHSYSGGEQSVQIPSAANYNMITGEVLTLGSILYHIDAKATLMDLVVSQADSVATDLQFYSDYADCIRDRFAREESYDEDWYFTQNGLCFYFSPYEIAPYSVGIVRLEVPYSELSGILADEFFPPEKDQMEGTLCAQLFADAELSQYTQIAEVILNPEGELFLLSAEGALRDVQVEVAESWDEEGLVYNPFTTVLLLSTLTPGDAILIQDYIPDTLPSIRITYRSGQEWQTVYLSQSGKDGSALLLSN